jgi:lipoprotein-releasing system ATP-binding protein
MTTPLIKVKNITKSFKYNNSEINVLKGLDFEIEKGERVAILGKSGIGKSTFLHILGTLERPDKGEVLFEDKNVFKFNDEKLAGFRNKSIGFVFQFHYLLNEFTTIENVMMPAFINGINKKKATEKAEEILSLVGLKERLYSMAADLSGGERQRAALARAIVLNPLVLLADEPTGNLDKEHSENIHNMLYELNKKLDMTIIVVTHDTDLTKYMTRTVTIHNGRLI